MPIIDGPGLLNEPSTYVLGYAMGYTVPRHQTDASACTEYTMDEALAISMKGIGSEIEHGGPWTTIGEVVGYRPMPEHGKVEVLIEFPPSDSPHSIYAKNSLLSAHYCDLSLQHEFGLDDTTGRIKKRVIEVSVCREGARAGSHIIELFPSQALLNCQTHEFLRIFANRYGYPAPPQLSGFADDEQLKLASVVESKELDNYVNNTLWPRVAQRRKALLVLNGYIRASKAHKTNSAMSSVPPTNIVAASATSMATDAVAIPMLTGGPGTLQSTIGDQLAAAKTVQTDSGKPTTVVSAPITPITADNSGMALDAPPPQQPKIDGAAMLSQVQRLVDDKNSELARLRAELDQAKTNLAASAKKQQEIETKTKIDTFIDRNDKIWDQATRNDKKENMAIHLEAARHMPADAADAFMKARFDGLVKCAKDDADKAEKNRIQQLALQTQQRETAAAHGQFQSPEEQAMLMNIWRGAMTVKNSSNSTPTVLPASMHHQQPLFTNFAASVDEALKDAEFETNSSIDETASSKKAIVAAATTSEPAGKVLASKPMEASMFVGDNCVQKMYQHSMAMQQDMNIVQVPSLAELKRGGYVGGVVRKSAQTGGKYMTTSARFPEEIIGRVGMKEWNRSQNDNMMRSINTGQLYFKDQLVKSSLGMSQGQHDALVAQAVEGEKFCAKYATAI